MKTAAKACLGLGVLSLFAAFASYLALTDIWHGEADTRLEWRIVQISFVVTVVFEASALITFWRILFPYGDSTSGNVGQRAAAPGRAP